MVRVFKVGTRGSKLALKQTEIFINMMKQKIAELGYENKYSFEIKVIKTKGDKIIDSPLSKIPGKGFFVKEIEEELLKGNIDFAVHSLKDMPTEIPDGLEISAFLKRDNPADAIVGMTFDEIEKEKVGRGRKVAIGTSSLRREIQIKERFGEGVIILPLRGNVDTRLRKLESGEYDSVILAYCGLLRLGLENKAKQIINPREFLYAPGQGIIAVEARKSGEARELAELVDDIESRFLGSVERKIVQKMGGGCNTPFGICSEIISNSDGEAERKRKPSLFIKFFKYSDDNKKISYENTFEIPEKIKNSQEAEALSDEISSVIQKEI